LNIELIYALEILPLPNLWIAGLNP